MTAPSQPSGMPGNGGRVAARGRLGRVTGMAGRRTEYDALDQLIGAVRAGQSRVLVVYGEPGVGKTVLLEYLATRALAMDCRVARVVGLPSEMELAFAGLHQLCAPVLDRLDRIPGPQRDALRTAFGLAKGLPPDRFLVGLAVLSLLSAVAGEHPLICLVDDEQWLDQASAQALGFAARRLTADPVGLVFAAREPGAELARLPELKVDWLADSEARALLETALSGPLDERVRDLIVAETRGNLRALLELLGGLTPAEPGDGFGLPGPAALAGRIEDSFARQMEALTHETRMLLLAAAADALGGDHAEVTPMVEVAIAETEAGGQGGTVTYACWVIATLDNGLGRYHDALAAAGQAIADGHLYVSMWALPELIEAADRTGDTELAAGALRRLAELTRAGGTDFGLGIEARCRALVSEGPAAEAAYREAIGRLGRTQIRPDLARAHLLYGEWLRRENRRLDARVQLRAAHETLTALGMTAFAERARRELAATGEKVRRRSAETIAALTAQEAYIARLARDGRTNAEIGVQLFLSARTVEWHLSKVFTKLGISSRRDLPATLAGRPA